MLKQTKAGFLKLFFYRFSLCFLISLISTDVFFIRSSLATPKPIDLAEIENKEALFQLPWLKQFNSRKEKISQKYGTNFAFLINYCQQAILNNRRDVGNSRALWYMYFEIIQQLWPAGSIFTSFEVDKGRGVDKFLPTFSKFNTNTDKNTGLYLPEVYLTQKLLNDNIKVNTGKIDLSDWFDANEVANSGDTQFLSDALINALSIPFPSKGTGAMFTYNPLDWFYFQSGAATAKSSSTMVGLSKGFNSTLFLNEFGILPKIKGKQGNYRFIFSLNHEKQELIDDESAKDNQFGFSLSFDQAINNQLILFLRYGFQDPRVRDIQHFWSCGFQVNAPFKARKSDYLGVGVARSITGHNFREINGEDSAVAESIYEAYYSYALNEVLTISPHAQAVINPDADKTASTEAVFSLRFLLSF